MTFGERILLERRRKRLRQIEAASAAGILQGTLIDIERQRIEITEGEFHRIMGALAAYDRDAAA